MNLIRRSSLLIIVFILCASLGISQTEVITLMHVNDSHSTLAPIGPRGENLRGTLGGLARVATLINQERLTNNNLLLLHAGDLFVGDMFFNKYFGVPEFQMLKQLGFDAMAVGNHEFDLTPDVLYQSLETAFPSGDFPVLSANIDLSNPKVRPLTKHIKPFIIKEFGSVRVGIFGLTTPATNLLSQPFPAIIQERFDLAAAATVEALKAQDCDVVVCVSHLGVQLDMMLAGGIPGIDVIVGGHDHFLYRQPLQVENPVGKTTYIVQANAFYLNMGKMTMRVEEGELSGVDYNMFDVDATTDENVTVSGAVNDLIAGIELTYGPVYSEQFAYANGYFEEVVVDFTSAGNKDTPIGNLVSDVFRNYTGTDIAIAVGGSTAQPLYNGYLVGSDLFRVVGYGFNTSNGLGYRLATFKIKGKALWAGLEVGVSDFNANYDELLVQGSGINYIYDPARPAGSRVTYVEVNGQFINPNADYTVTANESVPIILRKLGLKCANIKVLPISEFEVLAGALQGSTLMPFVEGRVVCAPSSPLASPLAGNDEATDKPYSTAPVKFALEQNYPNPFNPSTTVSYGLPVAGFVSLKIFNVLGQEVAVLVSGDQAAGQHQVVWNASSMPSGIYLMRLEAVNSVAVRKMQLVK